MPRVLGGFQGSGRFLMGEVPLLSKLLSETREMMRGPGREANVKDDTGASRS